MMKSSRGNGYAPAWGMFVMMMMHNLTNVPQFSSLMLLNIYLEK